MKAWYTCSVPSLAEPTGLGGGEEADAEEPAVGVEGAGVLGVAAPAAEGGGVWSFLWEGRRVMGQVGKSA